MHVFCTNICIQFRRYYLKGHPYIVSAGSYCSEESAVAISALAHALHETDTLALVRYVYKDDSAPKLGVLFPLFEKNISLLHYVEVRRLVSKALT
jgi:hypothetical protein